MKISGGVIDAGRTIKQTREDTATQYTQPMDAGRMSFAVSGGKK